MTLQNPAYRPTAERESVPMHDENDDPGTSAGPWPRIALWLVAGTMVYNILEAVIALWAGAVANSIALLGFGFDSVIETAAAGVMLWRLALEVRGADPEELKHRDHRVHQFVGATFILLAIYVTTHAGWSLWVHEIPHQSPIGIILAATSLAIMPLVSWAKFRAAREIGSAALRAEAKETLACSYLSFALLLGLVANSLGGWWWADPGAALLMVPWLVKEGREGLAGDACA